MHAYLLFFELRQSLRSPFYYCCLLLALGGAVVMVLGNAGIIDGADLSSDPQPIISSAYALSKLSDFYFYLFLLTTPFMVGDAIYRDYGSRAYQILFSYPLRRTSYLFGKLGSVLVLNVGLWSILLLGTWITLGWLGSSHPRVQPLEVEAFAASFGVYLLPNVIVLTTFVFAVVGWTRSRLAGLAVVLGLFCWPFLWAQLAFRYPELLAYLDPFGQEAFHRATRSWEWTQRQESSWPVTPLVWANRLLWLTLGVVAVGYFYRHFRLEYPVDRAVKGRKVAGRVREYRPVQPLVRHEPEFSWLSRLRVVIQLANFYLRLALRHWFFWLMLLGGGLLISFLQWKVTHTGDFNLLPQTSLLLGAPLRLYALVVLVVTFGLTGQLLHLARDSQFHSLFDATPLRQEQHLLALVLSLAGLQLIMLLAFVLTSVSLQTASGYHHYELGLYCYHLLVFIWPSLLLWILTSITVFTLLPGLLSGLVVVFSLWMSGELLRQVGWESLLSEINGPPVPVYSELYGYGSTTPYYLLLIYWIIWGIVAVGVTLLSWRRGEDLSRADRWRMVWQRSKKGLRKLTITALTLALVLGIGLLYQEHAERVTVEPRDLEQLQAEWSEVSSSPLPQIQEMELKLDLFPENGSLVASGRYLIVNTTKKPLDTLLVRTGFDERTELRWNKEIRLLRADSMLKYYLYLLATPLEVGDSLSLYFQVNSLPNGYFTRNTNVLPEATFLRHDLLPRLGWLEYGVDTTSHYFGSDASRLHVHTRISLPATQHAIAPGALRGREKQGDRHTLVYQTERPVKFNFSFHAGNYALRTAAAAGVRLEVYHHPKHTVNLGDMLAGLRAALRHNEARFGQYPSGTLRIVEVPHTEADFAATLMANNIPASERLFSINAAAMQDKLNFPFYVMAHELTHEWFGNQLLPARAPGATVLTESITEYLTLGMYEEQYGSAASQRFLYRQDQRYQQGRLGSRFPEPALRDSRSEQQYLTYGKGSLVLRALSRRLGREQFDALLASFLLRSRLRPEKYPTVTNLANYLRSGSPQRHHSWISEALEQVVHYDLSIEAQQLTHPDSLDLRLAYQRWRRGKGAPLVPLTVAFAQYTADGKLLTMNKIELEKSTQDFRVYRSAGAARGVLDPDYLFLDSERSNNRIAIRPLHLDDGETGG